MTKKNEKLNSLTGPAGGWGAVNSVNKLVLGEGLHCIPELLKANQPDGFDCPGCAWPDPKDASTFEFCENGVKAITAEVTKKKVAAEFFAQHCVVALESKSHHWLEDQGRLVEPMVYDAESDTYKPIEWDDAFALIAKELKKLDSPDEAIFYTSGRTSNEAAFLYQLMGRIYGTNNFPDCSNMCHESSGAAMYESVGIGKGTVSLEDFDKADAIFIFGQNPGTNHPRMLISLEKASERGAKILAFNPLREAGLVEFLHPKRPVKMLTRKSTPISSHYYQLLIGGDLAALQAIIKYIFEQDNEHGGNLDSEFIDTHCSGFEEFKKHIEAADWDLLLRESGLSYEQIAEAAEVYMQSERVIICWAMGLTQHKHAVATIQEIINLLLLRGNIGREGAGACPVRGHSNVQGDRTVGITEKPSRIFLDRLGQAFNFKPPRKHGYHVVSAIKAMAEGRAKVFIAMGGNFAAATPDTQYTENALRRCDLTVHVTTKLNRSHIVHGKKALILPCLGRTEIDEQASGPQSVTVEDSMSVVHASRGKRRPASAKLLSEPAIIAGIAKALFNGRQSPDWDELIGDYSRIRDKIEEVVPLFKNYNKRIQNPGGFQLRNSAAHREWNTGSTRANFTTSNVPELGLEPGQFRLMTIRSHDQYNTTIYSHNDRYRGIKNNRKVLLMNPLDIEVSGLSAGDRVDIQSIAADGINRIAPGFTIIEYNIPRGCLASYFPETNVLVPIDNTADKSYTPTSKFIPVNLIIGG